MKKVMPLVLPMILVVCAGILTDGPIRKPLALNVAVRLSIMYIEDEVLVLHAKKWAPSELDRRAVTMSVTGSWLAGFIVNIITIGWALIGGAT